MALFAAVLGMSGQRLARLPLPGAWTSWLRSAVAEEEQELGDAIRAASATRVTDIPRWTSLSTANRLVNQTQNSKPGRTSPAVRRPGSKSRSRESSPVGRPPVAVAWWLHRAVLLAVGGRLPAGLEP